MADGDERPKRGRPRIGADKRSVSVAVRVTPEQSAAMHEAARRAGRSLAQFILDRTIGG